MQLRSQVLTASVLAFAVSLSSGQSLKTSGASSANPFDSKQKKLQVSSQSYRSFKESIRTLGERIPRKSFDRTAPSEITVPDIDRPAELIRLRQVNGGPVQLMLDEHHRTPVFIRGTKLQKREAAQRHNGGASRVDLSVQADQARAFLSENSGLLRINDAESEFLQTDLQSDQLGMTHIRFQQTYKGFDVWGADARVHVTRDGNVESYNGRTIPTPTSVDGLRELVDEVEAVRVASSAIGRISAPPTLSRVIDMSKDGSARKYWVVNVRGALDENKDVFVDMETGVIARTYDRVWYDGPATGQGTDLLNQNRTLGLYQVGTTYFMINTSKAMFNAAGSSFPHEVKGGIYTLDAKNADSSLYYVTSANNNSWTDKASVSASYNSSKVYDFYSTVYGRNAIDGAGSTMNVVVNFKTGYNNAFWNGQLMVFGNGDGTAFSDLSASLDVTAHEMTHGVVERTANLVYENQPGALNESFADVFGVLFEFWAEPGTANWFMGETITTPGTPGDALRRLDDPNAANIAFGGQQPEHMDQYQNLPNTSQGDHGGVHTNSGIPNKAFYNLATSANVTKEEAGQIYYRALTMYLTRNAQFVDARLAVIKAAEDLYGGPGNAKATAAAAAFDAVGIGSGGATPPPAELPPVQGSNYLAVIDAFDFSLYRMTTAGGGAIQVTPNTLYSRPTVTDNGQQVLYVDGATNLHVVDSDGTDDQALSSTGGFNNVSISPDGRYLAATSVYAEPVIYIFDLQSTGNDKVLPLYTPTYSQGETAGNVQYPDRIDWMSNSQVLMYDCYNTIVNAAGDTVGYWDINLIRPADTAIARLFPPQAEGVNIGNAVFASNTDNIIAFDYFEAGDSVLVLAVDLNTGAVGKVTNNVFSLGSPSFSFDDGTIYYHYISQSQVGTWRVTLAPDGITGNNDDVFMINGGIYPVAFTTGTRVTRAEEDPNVPIVFGLGHNYPNPFNPETQIGYSIQESGFVKMSVFDILGREVAELVKETQSAGAYRITWNAGHLPSGVYLCKLESGGKTDVKRMVLMK